MDRFFAYVTAPKRLSAVLYTANLFAALLHLVNASAVFLIGIMKGLNINFYTFFPAWDSTNELFMPAFQYLCSANIGWLPALFSLITVIFHVLQIMRLENYKKDVLSGVNLWRWIEYSLSAPILGFIINVEVGIVDLPFLIVKTFLHATVLYFGYCSDIANREALKTEKRVPIDWMPFVFSSIVFVVDWVITFLYFGQNAQQAPLFVQFIVYGLIIQYLFFPVILFLHYYKVSYFKNPVFTELAFVGASYMSKTFLVWNIAGGAIKHSSG
jgi:hypothetical protein